MPTYRFLGLTPRFYPGVRGDDGRSLMAVPGEVYELDTPLDDGYWVLAEATPDDPPAGPEPAPEPVTPEPEAELTPVAPEPAEAVSPPVTEPPAEGPKPFYFPGIQSA